MCGFKLLKRLLDLKMLYECNLLVDEQYLWYKTYLIYSNKFENFYILHSFLIRKAKLLF